MPMAVWVTTPAEITRQVNEHLACAFGASTVDAIDVADDQPTLYNATVVLFFRDAIPTEHFELRDFTLIFSEGSPPQRVHNAIAFGGITSVNPFGSPRGDVMRHCRFLSSAGEQKLEEHQLIWRLLEAEHEALLGQQPLVAVA